MLSTGLELAMRRWEVYHPLLSLPTSYLSFFLSFRRFGSRRRYNRFPWCSPAFWEKIEPVCKTKKALPAIRGRPLFPALWLFLLILPTFYPSRGRDSWEPKRFPSSETTEFRCRRVEKAVIAILITNKKLEFFFLQNYPTATCTDSSEDRGHTIIITDALLAVRVMFAKEQNWSENDFQVNLQTSASNHN